MWGFRIHFIKISDLFPLSVWKRYFVVIHAKFNYTDYSGVKVHLATLSPDCMCYTPKRQTMIGFNGSQSRSAGFGRSRKHLPWREIIFQLEQCAFEEHIPCPTSLNYLVVNPISSLLLLKDRKSYIEMTI